MMKGLKSDEPYEVAPGCPTISFDLGGESLMLAYSSFVSGCFKGDRIELLFQEWRIEVEGSELGDVWRLLQTQDLRVIRFSTKERRVHVGCWVNNIVASKVGGEGDLS